MAFDQQMFAPVGGNASPSPSTYSYSTDDSFSAVTTASYFADKSTTLEEGDIILAAIAGSPYMLTVGSETSTAGNGDPTNTAYTQTPLTTSNGVGTETVVNGSLTFQKHELTGATRTYDFSAVDGACNKKFKLEPSIGCVLTIVGAKVLAGSITTLVGSSEYQMIFTCITDDDNDRDVLITELTV